jgi:murein DD-endopeptidase MepM/ murein hydrolase activator NlpD
MRDDVPLRGQVRARRRSRAEAVAVPKPQPLVPEVTLADTLSAVGLRPSLIRAWASSSHGLLWRWFAFEATWLAVTNLAASVLLSLAAMTMTKPGMALAAWLGIAPAIYVVLNDGLPYLAFLFLACALLKAAHALLDRDAHISTRVLGYGVAAALAAAGIWTLVMLGYASVVPFLLKPVLAFAGGETLNRLHDANAALVSYFEPVLISSAGLLLLARQFKTGALRRAPRHRKHVALAGVTVSLAIAAIAARAAYHHYTGDDTREGLQFAIGGTTLSGDQHRYGPLFAKGVPCHVSSLYGWRDDPLSPGHAENHKGIDIGVKEATPVHAMTSGLITFAEFDGGLGNFVALQSDTPGAATVVNGHMSRLVVRRGEIVRQGDIIGYAGSTGRSTGPHVHVQICQQARIVGGSFVCGVATNPYENWPTLAALSRMACADGPAID